MKWASAKDKLKLKNFVIPNNLKINVQNPNETIDQGWSPFKISCWPLAAFLLRQ